jgi:hypothetical protein
LHLAQAGIFALFGPSDLTARVLFVFAGLLLVAMSFEMRHYIGRAGALGIGSILAVSPSVTWFSRSHGAAIVSAALGIVVIALFKALQASPTHQRAIGLGLAGGFLLAVGPSGWIIAATLLASLALLGIGFFFVTRNAWLQIRVWLDRYASLVAIVILSALGVCLLSQISAQLPLRGLIDDATIMAAPRPANLFPDLCAALLPFSFYEFMLALAAASGLIIVAAMRVLTPFATFTLIWALLSFVFYLSILDPASARIPVVITPAALLAGVAIDYLYHRRLWHYLRYFAAAILALTVYVQIATNFVNSVADASEPAWAHHTNLYWDADATTLQTADRSRTILQQLAPAGLTVFSAGPLPPELRWYLRGLRPVGSAADAGVVVDATQAPALDFDPSRSIKLLYTERWTPDPRALDLRRAERYFFLQESWGKVETRTATIEVREEPANAAPTLILPPAAP